MKKILTIMTAAAVLAATLTGCSSSGGGQKLSEKEYKKQVVELFCDHCDAFQDATDVLNDFSFDSVDDFDEYFDKAQELKKDLAKKLEKADECRDEIKGFVPPEDLEDFHEDLLSLLDKSQDMEDKILAIYDAKTEEKAMSAAEKVVSSTEKYMNALVEIGEEEDYEWFVEDVEDELGNDGYFG